MSGVLPYYLSFFFLSIIVATAEIARAAKAAIPSFVEPVEGISIFGLFELSLIFDHFASNVRLLFGILSGISGVQPSNLYPLLVGFAGTLIFSPA